MKKIVFLGFLIMTVLVITGCETEGDHRATSQSAIPWNRPASWEGAGVLGAMGMGSH